MWYHTTISLVIDRWRQKDQDFKAYLIDSWNLRSAWGLEEGGKREEEREEREKNERKGNESFCPSQKYSPPHHDTAIILVTMVTMVMC